MDMSFPAAVIAPAVAPAVQSPTVSTTTDVVGKLDRLLKSSTKKTYDNCKAAPGLCAQQIVLDGLVLVAMYMMALYLIDGVKPTWEYVRTHVVKYMTLFIATSFVLRFMEVDFADALSRGAAVFIAAKFLSALAIPPKV